jgi:hypothetical protein
MLQWYDYAHGELGYRVEVRAYGGGAWTLSKTCLPTRSSAPRHRYRRAPPTKRECCPTTATGAPRPGPRTCSSTGSTPCARG